MSLLGGLNPISLLATTALGPIGGIVAQLATQMISQMGQQLIQKMGDELGLPQSAIDMAQGAFSGAMGDVQGSAQNLDEAIDQLGQETGASPMQIGDEQRSIDDNLTSLAQDLAQSDDAREARAGGKGGGWLMAMARALGASMDKMANQLESMANEIAGGKASMTSEFTALSQQFSLLSNAATNGIKTIGESMSNMARKQ